MHLACTLEQKCPGFTRLACLKSPVLSFSWGYTCQHRCQRSCASLRELTVKFQEFHELAHKLRAGSCHLDPKPHGAISISPGPQRSSRIREREAVESGVTLPVNEPCQGDLRVTRGPRGPSRCPSCPRALRPLSAPCLPLLHPFPLRPLGRLKCISWLQTAEDFRRCLLPPKYQQRRRNLNPRERGPGLPSPAAQAEHTQRRWGAGLPSHR